MSDDRKDKLKAAINASKPAPASTNSRTININVSGHGNIVARNVHITPGQQHITEQQAAHLQYLVHEVARLECIHSKNPVFMPAIWGKLKNKMQVASYKLIPHGHYHEAEQFLLAWRDQVLRDKTRSVEEIKDRSRIYRICHAIAKQYNATTEMRTLMMNKWKEKSMRDLDDNALQELLIFMRAIEAQHNSNNK